MNGLLTDLYELTMAAGYFESGKAAEKAVFEYTIRRLPPHRNFILAAGLPQVVDYLLNLSFAAEEIDYLRGLDLFRLVSPAFFDYLRGFRFTGDLFAIPEGTPVFSGEPVLTIRAPIVEAQIPETYVLSAVAFQSLISTKAARSVEVAGGRAVVEFGTRRAHTPGGGRRRRARRVHRRLRRHQQHTGGLSLRHPRNGHLGALLGHVGSPASWRPFASSSGFWRCHGPAHRYLRHLGRRAPRGRARPAPVGRAHR